MTAAFTGLNVIRIANIKRIFPDNDEWLRSRRSHSYVRIVHRELYFAAELVRR